MTLFSLAGLNIGWDGRSRSGLWAHVTGGNFNRFVKGHLYSLNSRQLKWTRFEQHFVNTIAPLNTFDHFGVQLCSMCINFSNVFLEFFEYINTTLFYS